MNIPIWVRRLPFLLPLLGAMFFSPLSRAGGHDFSNVSLPTPALTLIRANQIELSDSFAFTNSISVSNSGVFTNVRMNEYSMSLLNSCNPTIEYRRVQTGAATEAITGCIAVPSGASNHQDAAIAGYANTASKTPIVTGGYFQAIAMANGSLVTGGNMVAEDKSGLSSNVAMQGLEVDTQPLNSTSAYANVQGIGDYIYNAFSGHSDNPTTFTGSKAFIADRGYVSPSKWDVAFYTGDGGANVGLRLGAQCSGANTCSSQAIRLRGNDAGTYNSAFLIVDDLGDWEIEPTTGALTKILNGVFKIPSGNFSTLPSCSSTLEGATAAVSDSTTNTWGATITGSGSDHVLAYCDGTNWTVAAK